jgi:DNA-binding NtrC family response regulator
MPLKIYFVDDELDLLSLYKELFEQNGIEVVTFDSPKLALHQIANSPPDVLFLDYRMIGMTCDDLALQVDPKIPKILLTGDLNAEVKNKYFRIIKKPFEDQEIWDAINSIKNLKKAG